MNERMYELINQCFIGTTDGKLSELNTVANIEKFAELIVRECIEQSMSIGRYNTPSGVTPDLSIAIAVGLKKHFGVE